MLGGRLIALFRRARDDEKGIAMVEFALCAPFLLILMMGAVEVSRYIIINQKLDKVAFTVSDVVAQSTVLTSGGINQLLVATQDIMEPYNFGADGIVYITSVTKDPNDYPTVRWRHTGGGGLSGNNSQVGDIGLTANLPAGFTLNDRDNIIIAEVYYRFTPLLTQNVLGEMIIYKMAIYKPRLGTLTAAPL